jgi:hypothetical protein
MASRRGPKAFPITSLLLIHLKGFSAIVIDLLLDGKFFGRVRASGEICELVTIGGKIFEAKEDDLVFVLGVGRPGKTGHDEFRLQDVSVNSEEALCEIRFFPGFVVDAGYSVVENHGMLIVAVS